jgi:radical SAM superfamily enzyme YgiQ (UPF0313 family)
MKPDIVFYQQYATPYFGVIALMSYLAYKGLRSDVIIDSLEKDSLQALEELAPGLIGISVLSPEHNWLIGNIRSIKKAMPHVRVVVGGLHAMFYAEEILKDSEADFVCSSEGEEVLYRLIRELEKGTPDFSQIEGLCYRDAAGEIRINERAPLIPFNDDIIESRDAYYERYPDLARDTVHKFFSSRGCPYRCSFCYNANIHDLFKGKGAYIRQKSARNFIEEILSQKEKYSITSIFFYDDLFTFNKKWLKGFLAMYRERVSIPFMCTTRANLIDEDTVRLLAEAGCRTASFGIETGNADIRMNVLNKRITDEEIVKCGTLLSKYGIKVQTANMFCLPTETIHDALKTIDLNIEARTDYAFSALFMPFPKTGLTEFCIRNGLLKPDYGLRDMPYSFLSNSVLKLPNRQAIINVHYMAFFCIRYPWLYRLCKSFLPRPSLRHLYYMIFLFSNLVRHKEERGISWYHAIRYAWRLRKSF